MSKYSLTITLQTVSQYDKVTFTTSECDSPEEAEKELKEWINQHPILLERALNKEIMKVTLNG